MRSLLFLPLIIMQICAISQASAQTYHVRRIPKGSLDMDGTGTSQVWTKAEKLDDFVYPWDSVPAPATQFSALWDGEWFYGMYKVKDDSIFTPTRHNTKMDAGASDRVEIFLKKNDSMTLYYGLEMDAAGRVLDYSAAFYRKMNYTWSWPQGQLIIKTSRTKDGYVLEFAISIQSLKDLGLLQNSRLQAGLFRAECTGTRDWRTDLHWISWIRPRADHADFHIPSAFGILVLE